MRLANPMAHELGEGIQEDFRWDMRISMSHLTSC